MGEPTITFSCGADRPTSSTAKIVIFAYAITRELGGDGVQPTATMWAVGMWIWER